MKHMKIIENQIFDEERALYASVGVTVKGCRFEGEADGESALKESSDVTVEDCLFDLRYPFWHDTNLNITRTELTEHCRAPLWYSHHVSIECSKLHGVKALRECSDVSIRDTDIISSEFGWSVDRIHMRDTTVQGEYFMLRSCALSFENVQLKGKYSFQYISDSVFDHCSFHTKDAFWHAKNVVIKNSLIRGEYLAWYAENITFDHCTIIGTQPLCYCKGLRLIDCEMIDADLSFEKSQVEATLTNPIVSIKNPTSGHIRVSSLGELIQDDPMSTCRIEITGK